MRFVHVAEMKMFASNEMLLKKSKHTKLLNEDDDNKKTHNSFVNYFLFLEREFTFQLY
jgi:hypothetical protein